MSVQLPLTRVPRQLLEANYPRTSYRRVYGAALSGFIPCEQGENGRWTFCPDDLPAIAEGLGLTANAHAA